MPDEHAKVSITLFDDLERRLNCARGVAKMLELQLAEDNEDGSYTHAASAILDILYEAEAILTRITEKVFPQNKDA